MGAARAAWAWWLAPAVGAVLLLLVSTARGEDSALVAAGQRLYTEQGCHGCHTMGKAGTPIAPDLSKIGAKYREADLRRWLLDPQQQKPRAHMPRIQMSEAEARALAAYLSTLR